MRLLAGFVLALSLSVAAGARCEEAVPYRAELSGVEGTDLAESIEAASQLISLQDRPPASVVALKRRADDDHARIVEALRSEGYYEGDASITMDDTRRPVPVHIHVDPGPEFRLARYDVAFHAPKGQPAPEPVPLDMLGVELGEPARAGTVLQAQDKLLQALAQQGYPLAKVADRQAVVDHADKEMRVTVTVDSGPLAHFGTVTIEGLHQVSESWVRNRIPWRTGDRFSLAAMDRLRKRLVDSRLFSSVRLSTGTQVNANGELPITVALTEGKKRSVGGGGNWSTTEGFGGQAFWENRNLLGGAETLRAEATVSQIMEAADLAYTAPDLRVPGEDFIASTRVEKQITEAYTTRTAGAAAGLSWQLGDTWRASASTAVERTLQLQEGQNASFTLVSLPFELRHDSTDSILDPSTGDRMVLTDQPFLNVLGTLTPFNRISLYDTRYLQVFDRPRTVLAGWLRAGAIQGVGVFQVPANRRFYVGGGGSVRGFGYQKAGPIDTAGVSVGGASELSFGGEVRVKVTDTIGLVPFLEGGRAYEQRLPDFSQEMFWGAGIGVRYYTPIGPVRADIAFPLNPRPGIDDGYQLYFSLGQAF
ncbi:MAG: autotransporter assembly complex protein TamA [Magnetospirillum sp.]|nr:autotransporter assembly complex protein TamA [Magnetospirillum sp.]